jgi:hypothetical protein
VAVLKETIMAFAKTQDREKQVVLHFAGTKVPKHGLALPWLRTKVRALFTAGARLGGAGMGAAASSIESDADAESLVERTLACLRTNCTLSRSGDARGEARLFFFDGVDAGAMAEAVFPPDA